MATLKPTEAKSLCSLLPTLDYKEASTVNILVSQGSRTQKGGLKYCYHTGLGQACGGKRGRGCRGMDNHSSHL